MVRPERSGGLGPVLRPLPAALLLVLAAPLCRAELKVATAVDSRVTYTDNVNLATEDQARALWIGELSPTISLSDQTSRLRFNATYQGHLYGYSHSDPVATQSADSQFNGALHAEALTDWLYLDAAGAYSQQAVSAFGQPVADNGYSTANRAHVKSYQLSPYLSHRWGSALVTQLHYTHDAVSSDQPGFGSSNSDRVLASIASGAGAGRLSWSLQGSRQQLDTGVGPSYSTTSYNLGGSLRVLPTLALTASAGHERYDYESQLNDLPGGKSWSLGFNWTPTSRSSLAASFGKRYFGNSNSLDALHRSMRTVWTLNYSTDVTTSRDQFLLPAAVSTADLLDRMFASTVPDAATRRQVVQAFIQANGLPSALLDSVNYLSNRYILQKQLQLSTAWNLPRSALIFSLYDTRRTALSQVQTDSTLQGSFGGTINDNTRQQGGGATLNLRLTSRSSVNLAAAYSRSRSLTDDVRSVNRLFRVSLTQQLGRKLSGDVELRRQQGQIGGATGGYRENAVVFHLNQRF